LRYTVFKSDATTRTLRKDAELNKQRLLDSARTLFAEHGVDVTLNDIAHHAGVGVGTAYRRFPNKEAIIDALFEEGLHDVAGVAQQSLADPDAWKGLVGFLEGTLSMQWGGRGLIQIMNHPALGEARAAEARDRIAPLITEIVARAKAQGTVRPDLDQTDIIFIQLALAAILDSSRAEKPDLYTRYLTFFLDGIRADRHPLTSLPVPPLTAAETHRALTRLRRLKRDTSSSALTPEH